jgi:outer membrane protein OmpA-like peptidoglycan-associated protein
MELRKLLAGSALATLGAILATVAAAPAAQAQHVDGLYVGAGAGLNMLQDETIAVSPALGTTAKEVHFDAGWRGLAAVGYGLSGLGLPVRLEIEGDYFNNHVQKVMGSGAVSSSGYEQKYGAMGNAYYDVDPSMFGLPLPVFPYVGIGGGYLVRELDGFGYSGTSLTNHRLFSTGGNKESYGGFAYQAIAGLSYPLPFYPGLSATVEYRFTGMLDPLTANGGHYVSTGTAEKFGNRDFGNDLNHSVLVGLRLAFNVGEAPAPAPAPTPVAAPARSYLVFFDWDKAVLTTRARQIIHEAADNSTKVQYTKIEVNGYTDTSGTPQYNQGLSIRRAQAVAAELVRDGVPRAAISIQGFGETHLLVPTGPGVREPQNRRVEIIIQ